MEKNNNLDKRRQREMTTISQMIALYCHDHHEQSAQTEIAHCGESVCVDCLKLDSYAVFRTEHCRQMATKTTCEDCENHCYAPGMRERIREIMRYSGPRMAKKHPVSAIRHVVNKARK